MFIYLCLFSRFSPKTKHFAVLWIHTNAVLSDVRRANPRLTLTVRIPNFVAVVFVRHLYHPRFLLPEVDGSDIFILIVFLIFERNLQVSFNQLAVGPLQEDILRLFFCLSKFVPSSIMLLLSQFFTIMRALHYLTIYVLSMSEIIII